MLKLSTSRTALICLSGTLAFAGVACSSDRQTLNYRDNVPLATKSTPSAALTKLKPVAQRANLSNEKVQPKSSQPNFFELALDKAYSAFNISQSAQSSYDWNLVMSQWQEAIALLKAVPATSPNKVIAQKKLIDYQRNLIYAQQQANRPIKENPDNIVAVIPEVPPSNLNASGTAAVEALPLLPNQAVYQAIIKRRLGGTPVINVTFNGTQQFEMIVDTGASGTVITQQTAATLGVVPVAKAKANTASAKDVEFGVGYVDSIEAGGAVVKNVPIAIAPSSELEIGLLGHDFFGNYDVTFKRDVVEFRLR